MSVELARRLIDQGQLDEAEDVVMRALTEEEWVDGVHYHHLAMIVRERDDDMERALGFFEIAGRLTDCDSEALGDVLFDEAVTLLMVEDYESALHAIEECADQRARVCGVHHLDYAMAIELAAQLRIQQGYDMGHAMDLLEKAIPIFERHKGQGRHAKESRRLLASARAQMRSTRQHCSECGKIKGSMAACSEGGSLL